MFNYSDTNKRYHTLEYANRQKYQTKVAKLSIDAGYTCINRDGTKGTSGCLFCPGKNISGFKDTLSITKQIQRQQDIIQRKWPLAKYQLYFQSFSNTYAPFEINKKNYDLFRQIENVISLAIATRVDSLSDKTLNYLAELNNEIPVSIELGLQSRHDNTRALLACGYSWSDFVSCVKRISLSGCEVVVHIINGLPQESTKQMLETINALNPLPIQGLKIHMLHLDSTSPLAAEFLDLKEKLLSQEDYCDIVIQQLRNLRPDIVIHRLTGDPLASNLIAPKWTLNKISVLNMIDKKMASLDAYQGDYA